MVVKVEETPQPQPRFLDGVPVLQVHMLILDRPPKPFHKNVVQCPAAPVHADFDALVQQRLGEAGSGELRALVGVEDFALPSFDQVADRLDAEISIQSRAQCPVQDVAAVPVHHRHQVHETRRQPDVSDVGAPHLVAAVNQKAAQQVRVDPMFRVPRDGVRLLVYRLQPHLPQQAPDSLGVGPMTQLAQMRRHFQHAITGCPGILFVQQPHED